MRDQWRLLCETLWPEPQISDLPATLPGRYKHTHFLLPYKNPIVKNNIRNNKFHFHSSSAKALATVVDQFLKRYPDATIIPIPSSTNRERKRGYDHLLNILQHSQHRNQVRVNILKKEINTAQQSHVSIQVRLRQQVGSFTCDIHKISSLPATVVLFDDVVTTEATMSAARETLASTLPTGTKIICFAIAH